MWKNGVLRYINIRAHLQIPGAKMRILIHAWIIVQLQVEMVVKLMAFVPSEVLDISSI